MDSPVARLAPCKMQMNGVKDLSLHCHGLTRRKSESLMKGEKQDQTCESEDEEVNESVCELQNHQ